ncbi:hypothetical protein [Halobacterium zhouii]|uniref:hypothetical protein n=1 Tax=Halobacterium zhouii TaxID=2902624 RepID=UPI001E5C848B|nr:hypothetical protein [Halobacterium zhouii]
MRRRALLGTIASLAAAGCTGRPPTIAAPGADDSATPTADRTSDPSPNETLDSSVAATLGAAPGQTDCPPFGDDTERVVCYPEQADAPLSLVPSADTADLPNADVTFTLTNDTGATFMTNFYGWALWKREHGQWFHVAPKVVPQPLHTLPSGESHEWRTTMTNTGSPDVGPSAEQDISLAGLGGGEYAFATDGWFEGGDYEHKVGLAARFDLNGDPVELTPTADASPTRNGDTVVVTTDAEVGENAKRAAFVVEAIRVVPPDRTVRHRITEQLLRPMLPFGDRDLFRNTIPFFEDGVTTVRLEAQTTTTPPFGVTEPRYIEYEGETYRVSTEELA